MRNEYRSDDLIHDLQTGDKVILPGISNMLLAFGIINRPITSVIRKGKDNYLCDQRLENYIKNFLYTVMGAVTRLHPLNYITLT